MANELMTLGAGFAGTGSVGLNLSLAGTPITWFEAQGYSYSSTGVLAVNNAEVEYVTPVTGSQGNMSQTGATLKPLYITNQTSNGKAVLRFDGSNDFMRLTNSLAIAKNVGAFSIIFVVKFNAVSKDQSMIFVSTSTEASTRFVWRVVVANSGLCFVRTLDADTGGGPSTTGFTATTGTFYTFHVSMDYTNKLLNAWVNGVQRITNSTPSNNTAGNTSNTDSGQQLAIGRDNGGTRYLQGDLVAWGAYSNVFTSQQVSDSYSAIQTYLGV